MWKDLVELHTGCILILIAVCLSREQNLSIAGIVHFRTRKSNPGLTRYRLEHCRCIWCPNRVPCHQDLSLASLTRLNHEVQPRHHTIQFSTIPALFQHPLNDLPQCKIQEREATISFADFNQPMHFLEFEGVTFYNDNVFVENGSNYLRYHLLVLAHTSGQINKQDYCFPVCKGFRQKTWSPFKT